MTEEDSSGIALVGTGKYAKRKTECDGERPDMNACEDVIVLCTVL